MSALLILIPLSLILVAAAVCIFFWAVRHRQFDDLDTPEVVPLLDEDAPQFETEQERPEQHGDPA